VNNILMEVFIYLFQYPKYCLNLITIYNNFPRRSVPRNAAKQQSREIIFGAIK